MISHVCITAIRDNSVPPIKIIQKETHERKPA